MINQNDIATITIPSTLQNIGIEQGNEEFINIIQLTNNSYYDGEPQIWGNNVVWSGEYNDGISVIGSGIYLYDGATTIQLTNNSYDNRDAEIWGNNVVWSGNNQVSSWYSQVPDGYDQEIFLYDGTTTIQLTNNNYDDSNPEIWGNNVVWVRNNFPTFSNEELFLYDGLATIQLTNNVDSEILATKYPQYRISGQNIVWSRFETHNIGLIDSRFPILSNKGIFLYDGTTTIQLTEDGYEPQIWGNNVVWQVYEGNDPESNDSEIFFSDGTTTIQLTDNNYDDVDPQIWGNNVVWSGDREIFLATLPSDISESTSVIISSSMFINDVSLVEGDEGNTDLTFTISIAEASKETITVNYATSDNTAIAGEDYIATSGSLEFAPGETEKTIIVEVIGDTNIEQNEIFTVNLSNVTNAILVDGQGNAVLENDELSEFYRFRNTNYEAGGYFFVGEEEKNAILANPDLNQTFILEGVTEDGTVNPAFIASVTFRADLRPFYRLRSLDTPDTNLFVADQEYDDIFAEDSDQKDKWIKEGFDTEGIDIPEFFLYGVGAGQGIEFHRFQDINNHSYLFAGPEETEAIYNDPLLSANFVDEGIAFESFI